MTAARVVAAAAGALLLLAGAAEARPKKQSVPEFYEDASQVVATIEFTQEFVAGGQRQQTRGVIDGFVVSPDGLVLIPGRVRFPQRGTSGRLSGGSLPALSGFELHFSDGREHRAEVVGFDDDLNLGLLRIVDLPPDGEIPAVSFRSGYAPRVGDGLRSMTLYTQEFGRKPVLSPVSVNALLQVPQAAWSLAGASSNILGAPLWDERGEVVGVVAELPMSPWGGRQVVPDLTGPLGLSYGRFAGWLTGAIASARAQQQVASEVSDADQAWMGVMFQPLERNLAQHLGLSAGGGIVVTRVVPGSPAEAAGLGPLDVLVELDGERIPVQIPSDTTAFSRKIRSYAPGTVIRFTREHPDGRRELVPLTLAPTPTSELHAERRSNPSFELTVRELTLDTLLAQRLGPETRGVVVDGVTHAGWAGLSGLSVGLIIQRINQHDVVDLDSFEAALAAVAEQRPSQVLFFVRHGRTTRFFVAEPDWAEVAPR